MRADKAIQWVETYLYSARGHRALEQSVLAAGERRGFSERKLLSASAALGVLKTAGCWELPPIRVAARDAHEIISLGVPAKPPVSGAGFGSRLRRHAA